MTFDQNSIPKDLRPLNLPRTVAEEPRIASVNPTSRNIEGFFPSHARDVGGPPRTAPVFYPDTVSDAGFVGLGYGNVVPGSSGAWNPSMSIAVGHSAAVNCAPGYGCNPNFRWRVAGNALEQTSDEGGDDPNSGKKVKFLCSFGGKILPRPSDGMLRYVGGQTRIIGVRRDVGFNELVRKMVDSCGQSVVIKYQLPDEDLDALVSVSCPDDLENMMEEYEKLLERSSDGSAKLRLFLFSTSDLDPSGMLHFGDLKDGEQRYVDAVNGVMDGVGGGITRKESIASVNSTQNSDLSGSEPFDSLGPGQGDVCVPPLNSTLSPRGNTANLSVNAPRLLSVDSNPAVYAEAPSVPLVIPKVKSPHPQNVSSQPELEIDRTVPSVQQLGVDLKQSRMENPQTAACVQTYVDTHLGAMNHADYIQLPPQMGFPNSLLLGTVGSGSNQQQFHDNSAGAVPHQYIPAGHMMMAPLSSNMAVKPNVVHPLMQPQQTRLDRYPEESVLGPRVVQLPGNQSYSAYQTQASPAVAGGGYGWPQVPLSEHVVFSEGWIPQQQLIFPKKIQRFEDCYMCQNALPHAHSDSLLQDQRDSGTSTVSDSNLVNRSLCVEENMGHWLRNRVAVTGPLGDGIGEHHVVGAPPMVLGHLDHEVGKPLSEAGEVPQSLDVPNENDRIMLHKAGNHDNTMRSVHLGAMGGVFMGGIPQSSQEDTISMQSVPANYLVKQDALMSQPVSSDVPSIGGVPYQTTESLVFESSKDYSGKLPGSVPKEAPIDPCISYDHLRLIDSRVENLWIRPPDILVSNEKSKSPVDKPRKDDILEYRQQQVAGREVVLDKPLMNPKMVFDANMGKASEMLPGSSTNVSSIPDNSGPYPHLKIGIHHIASDEVSYGNTTFSGVDSALVIDKIPSGIEWKDNSLHFSPKMVPSDVETVSSNSTTLSSFSPSNIIGDDYGSSNSFLGIQDPWNLRHDNNFLPPRPSKIQIKKEALGARDPFSNCLGNSGELGTEVHSEDGVFQVPENVNTNLSSEHVRSAKGSAEELIKQELQLVAEGVAASVLRSSVPSHSNDGEESVSEENGNIELRDSDVEMPQGIKTKLSEKTNFGFPVSDGIGRLQFIKNSDLEELRELGSGMFGTVYHGKWRGSDVAIKRINNRCFAGKPSEQERMRDDFWNEAIKLADLHHPNVVAFYGVVLDGPGDSVATVTEYMVNGSLRNALQKNEKNLDKRKRLLIAMDVAFGMEYLHEKNIVHFDLKSDNLLVNLRDPHRPICKVGDLGLSKVKCQTLISGGVRGTLPWMAPELLNGSSSLVSEKVDVFSFGIVLWELLTGEEPYADLHYGAIIGGIVSNTLRPHVPESCDPEWKLLMEQCWSADTSERPSFTEIANELRAMAAKIPSKGQTQQQQHSSSQTQVQK